MIISTLIFLISSSTLSIISSMFNISVLESLISFNLENLKETIHFVRKVQMVKELELKDLSKHMQDPKYCAEWIMLLWTVTSEDASSYYSMKEKAWISQNECFRVRHDKLLCFTRGTVKKFTMLRVFEEILESWDSNSGIFKKLGRWVHLGKDHVLLTRAIPNIKSGEFHWDLVLDSELQTESNTDLIITVLTSQRQ